MLVGIFMGTEDGYRPNYPVRPAASPFAAMQSSTPFVSSGPVVGSDASAFRPAAPPLPQSTAVPFSSGPPMGLPVRPGPPPPSSSYGPPTAASQRFPAPQFLSTGQVPPPRAPMGGPPFASPPTRTPGGPVSYVSQPQPPSVPMGSPPQSINTGHSYQNSQVPADQPFSPPGPNVQPSSLPMGPSYAPPRGGFQPAFPGYANAQAIPAAQAPPSRPNSFPLQGSYAPPGPTASFPPQQRGYAPGPPAPLPSGLYTGNQMQHHGAAPPLPSHGLAEDFNSLSLGSVPGSYDTGPDAASLPRPLDGDVEPKSFAEMFPMNCHSRYVRLTTSGLPNSQSLTSRWHLPLGAVVCPLAEAPRGVSFYCIECYFLCKIT